MANDPNTRLAPVDPWTTIDEAKEQRGRLLGQGCRTAVAWLYRGAVPPVEPGAPEPDETGLGRA